MQTWLAKNITSSQSNNSNQEKQSTEETGHFLLYYPKRQKWNIRSTNSQGSFIIYRKRRRAARESNVFKQSSERQTKVEVSGKSGAEELKKDSYLGRSNGAGLDHPQNWGERRGRERERERERGRGRGGVGLGGVSLSFPWRAHGRPYDRIIRRLVPSTWRIERERETRSGMRWAVDHVVAYSCNYAWVERAQGVCTAAILVLSFFFFLLFKFAAKPFVPSVTDYFITADSLYTGAFFFHLIKLYCELE